MSLRRIHLLSFSAVAALSLAPMIALAAVTPEQSGLTAAAGRAGLTNACGAASAQDCVVTIIARVISVALGFVGLVLLALFLWAGFIWMTAGGDEKKVAKARQYIYNAVAGLVIIGLSYALTTYILGQLSGALTAPAGP